MITATILLALWLMVLQEEIIQLTKENAELKAKCEALQSKCAEMNSPTWPWVRAFASEMERKLSLNRHKGDRDGWIKDDPWSLVERLLDETVEVQQCFTIGSDGRVDFKDAVELTNECADVANFAMMIADSAGGLKAHTDCGKGILEKVERLETLLKRKELDYTNCADSYRIEMEKVKVLRPYLDHKLDCRADISGDMEICNCGLKQIIAATATEEGK